MSIRKISTAVLGVAAVAGSGLALAPAAQAGDIVNLLPATRIVAQSQGAPGQLAIVRFHNYPIGCHLKIQLKNPSGATKKKTANMVDTPSMVRKTALKVQIPADANGKWQLRSTVRGCSKNTTKTTTLTIVRPT